ncbi:MAG: hypothetical protein NTV08_03460 [Verrucomicrobia bacterium]|nr:hypothetical protein [Verrucomicrobiota bacterium]
MSEGKRPGGLTALAVLNFVFGGFGVIGILALWAVYALVTAAAKTVVTAAAGTAGAQDVANAANAINQQSGALILISLILLVVSVTLLIVSGVGYLGQKKFIGQRLGSIYGVVSIAQTVLSILFLKSGFGIGTIIGLTYPILTLVLLNNTFKDDFVNP